MGPCRPRRTPNSSQHAVRPRSGMTAVDLFTTDPDPGDGGHAAALRLGNPDLVQIRQRDHPRPAHISSRRHWTFQSYQTIFNDPEVPLARFFLNSLFVAVMRVGITLFTSSLAGFIFAKYRFWGKNVIFAFILAQMMIPFQVVMIPAYLILVKLRLVDTLWGLIIPSMVDAFGIFLMRQFIESIPNELMDAARIDGAAEFTIYWRIILPQLGAPLAALGIFYLHGRLE